MPAKQYVIPDYEDNRASRPSYFYNENNARRNWASLLKRVPNFIEHPSHCLQDIDTAIAPITASEERSRVVDFPSPVYGSYMGAIITTKPKNRFFFVEPVHYSVWLLCCCIVLVTTISLHGFDSFTLSLRPNTTVISPINFYSTLWMNVRTLLNQGKCTFRHGVVHEKALTLLHIMYWEPKLLNMHVKYRNLCATQLLIKT